ncbi:siderophore-interacting protein [Devosia sp.]|jgi:NADPH-dependent ferric siderophore reductase|uniref:siderophore-interacting protein n=1 Tax=Devosia sp. TaxID=1871048 RepID=UPI0037C12FB2
MTKTPIRLRHETRIRVLEVAAVTDLTPRMRRITLAGEQLAGFASPGHADHIKVFFPEPGHPPVLPILGAEGLQFPADKPRPAMRDYTPRHFDAVALTLDVDFVLHGDGPAASWAAQADVGQQLVIGGPRGSLIVPTDYDWHLLIGDETGLPAIARRLEELPEGATAVVLIEIAEAAERQPLATKAAATIHWVERSGEAKGDPAPLLSMLADLTLPDGEAHTFMADESSVVKALKAHLVEARGCSPDAIRASGYWVYGVADAHEPH